MNVLTKHKKKGEEGFKRFIRNLETTPSAKLKNILEVCILEDPVYMKWILPNMIKFEYIMILNDIQIEQIYNSIANPAKTFVLAFWETEWQEDFEKEKLTPKILSVYTDEKEYTKDVLKNETRGAQLKIMQTIRDLQERRAIPDYEWQLPSKKVLNGSNQTIPTKGEFELNFENGTPALRGQFEDKMRAGQWKHYYPNGQLMAEGIYNLGEKVGQWTFYYPNGKVKASGDYIENLKEGDWTEYDISGSESASHYARGKRAA